MSAKCRKGNIKMWAWTLSLVFHIILLCVFAVIKFTQLSTTKAPVRSGNIVATIKENIKKAPIMPKPKMKRPALISGKIEKIPMDYSVQNKIKLHSFPRSLPQTDNSDKMLLPSTGISSTRTEFFGSFTDHRKICYVVDCSGSMQGLFNQVKEKLKDSISNLRADQYFYIIFFGGEKLIEPGDGKMLRASRKAKTHAHKFIDSVRPRGATNALNALKRAMGIRDGSRRAPAQIYFLTDGFDLQGDDTAQFSTLLGNLQKELAPMTRINTIGFWAQPEDSEILQLIAQKTGGEYINVQ